MKSHVALQVRHGEPLVIDEIELPAPGPDQVLVRHLATGICHSQLHQMHNPSTPRPALLGHEATGIIEAKGANVTHVKEGDRVVVTWVPRAPQPGVRPPPCVLPYRDGEARAQSVYTWGEHCLVHEQYVLPLDADLPDDVSAPIGCAVLTGVGAAQNTANVQAGQSVAVFGAGGVGLCVIAGAAARRAHPIIAVDLSEEKLEFAKKFGATHGINARVVDPVQQIVEMTGGGVDYAFDAIGHASTIQQILAVARPGQLGYSTGGTAVLVGVPQQNVELDLRMLLTSEKKFIGSIGGSTRPQRDFPHYYRMYREGELDLKALVTRRYPFAQINDAVSALERGEVLGRCIVVF